MKKYLKQFDNFYKDYSLELEKYIYKKLWQNLDYQNVLEIINKSFLVLYEKNNVENIANYETYLKKISFNVMRNVFMYKKRYYNKNLFLDNHLNYKHSSKDPLQIIINKEFKKIMLSSLNILTILEKKIIVLYYFYDFKYVEIASILQISYLSLKKIEKKALIKLKHYLENLDYELTF